MKPRIIFQLPGKPATVIVPYRDWYDRMDELAARLVPAGVPFDIVDDSELPADRTLRDAWDKVGKNLQVNRQRAEAIVSKRIADEADRKVTEVDEAIAFNDAFGVDSTKELELRAKLVAAKAADLSGLSVAELATTDLVTAARLPRKPA